MSSADTPQLVVDQRFADMGECGQKLGWDFDFRQLDPGRLDARATLLATASGSTAMRFELNRSFHQAGSPPDGLLTFGIPEAETGEIGWSGARATGTALLNFNLPSGFDGMSRAGFTGYTLSFTERLFQDVQRRMGVDLDTRSRVSEHPVWNAPSDVTARLRRGLITAFRTATAARGSACWQAREFFDFEAPALILRAIAGNEDNERPPDLSSRLRAVCAALDFLEASDHLPLTASELCRQVGVSAPSLYRGFMERFGIGPKRYLHIRRLEGARRELRSAAPEARVADIAGDWGFWHMGHFAADYRNQFGELPSQTLRR